MKIEKEKKQKLDIQSNFSPLQRSKLSKSILKYNVSLNWKQADE